MQIDASNVEALARGCAILGAGGGGDTGNGVLMALQAIEDFGPVEVLSLDELDPLALIMPCGMLGAPTVSFEKLPSGAEGDCLVAAAEAHFGTPVSALMTIEIGGSNGLIPIAWAARLGRPIVDADGMGRAFPQVPQVSMELAGLRPDPMILADERGHTVICRGMSGEWAERVARTVAVSFGGWAAEAEYFMTADVARTAAVRGSISRALVVGHAVEAGDGAAIDRLVAEVGAVRVLDGKIVDVDRLTAGGFVRGSVVIEGVAGDAGRLIRIEIQNENLAAHEGGEVIASVPDIIALLDGETATACGTESIRYGQRVVVVVLPSPEIWRTPAGLELVGPRAFGYDFNYRPISSIR